MSGLSRSRAARWLGLGAASAAALLLSACGGDPAPTKAAPAATPGASQTSTAPSDSSSPAVSAGTSFTVAGGEAAGPAQLTVKKGSEVAFTVTSDADDELHVHGYDEFIKVAAGKPTAVSFPAAVAGVFEVELEEAGVRLTQLRVTP